MTPVKTAVIGNGAWGTALALHMYRQGSRVTVWGAIEDEVTALGKYRENKRYLPGVMLPADITFTTDEAQTAEEADIAFMVVPARFYRKTCTRFADYIRRHECMLVSATKGIEHDTFLRMSEILIEAGGASDPVVLSGPSHAEEVARSKTTSMVAASVDTDKARYVQSLLSGPTVRVYTGGDVAGVEYGGALKNVIAIGAGICDGMGLGDNAKAALVTRGHHEMVRFAVALGARQETLSGLSGMGDLMVTCYSSYGRNRWFGSEIGRGRLAEDVLTETAQAIEGVYTVKAVYGHAQARNIEMPVAAELYKVIYKGKSPEEAITTLMERQLKDEAKLF